ncbi:hypothetical protein IFM89_024227 [Coptis chinensis]|uniref:Uncharacterized protein n=1 Tax=Coptis chinensis TaxID=261450 RepID=A0A835HAV7_9MAGN|nr:hypothetical protein IFM89_024227 [Coptis chinensis]
MKAGLARPDPFNTSRFRNGMAVEVAALGEVDGEDPSMENEDNDMELEDNDAGTLKSRRFQSEVFGFIEVKRF